MTSEERILALENDIKRLKNELQHAQATTTEKSLVEYFTEAKMVERHKWLPQFSTAAAQRRTWTEESTEEKRKLFLAKAKASMVSPGDALLAMYLLFGDASALDVLRSLLIHTAPGEQRVNAHNLYIASLHPEHWRIAHGDTVATLKFPLFPPGEDFVILNQRLLDEASTGTEVTGAGKARPPLSVLPSVFRPEPSLPTGGEFWSPVQDTPSGPAVNLTVVEDAVSQIQRQLSFLQNRGRGGHQQNYRGRNRGRGQSNGRGVGYPRGGESSDQGEARPSTQKNF